MSARDDTAESIGEILERAEQRGRAKGLDYAGEVTPAEAWRLHEGGVARIVDVRTRPEYEFVGRVPGTPLIEWRRYGDAEPNPTFLAELATEAGAEEPILFICRSAVRSHHAAELATRAGFRRVFNVLEGFEGDRDASQQRGNLGG